MQDCEDINDTATPYVLCDKCKGFISLIQSYLQDSAKPPNLPRNTAVVQYLLRDVQASGLKGCHVCSIISQAIYPTHSEDDILTTSASVVAIYIARHVSAWKDSNSPLLFLDVQMKDPGGRLLQDATLSVEADPRLYLNEPAGASWSVSTGSDATFNLARSWLNHCLSEDKLCEEVRKTPASPHISPFPAYLVGIEPQRLRLCRSEDLPDRPLYLTLSHRWGGSHIIKLTLQNRAAMLSDIQLNDLPKTFQDAILITRRLGYRYIWIDSLCIIQDSAEHWKAESAIMGDIYRESTCTIAALGATDGDSGCFKSRNPLCFQRYTFELTSGQIVYLPPQKEKTVINRTGYGPAVEPLHQRAWVMQERMLSPRTLFYGTYGIYWECVLKAVDSNISSEIKKADSTAKFAIHQACSLTVTGQFDVSYKMFWQWWTRIISMYNPCGLTYGTDKLVAIAGIVKLVQSRTGLHTLAGMWKEYIYPELLWHVDRPQKRPAGPYQAPTWSWASLDSEVAPGIQDFNYTFEWKIELLDTVANLIAENGQLASAYIRVRGPLLKVRWELVEDDYGYKLRWGTRIAEENSADDRVVFLPDVEPDPKTELWALLVVHATSSTSWMKMGLVIAKELRDTGNTVWVRVGSFRQYDWPVNTTTFFEEVQAGIEVLVLE